MKNLPFTTVERGGITGTFFSGVTGGPGALLGIGVEVDCFRNDIPSIFALEKEFGIDPFISSQTYTNDIERRPWCWIRYESTVHVRIKCITDVLECAKRREN